MAFRLQHRNLCSLLGTAFAIAGCRSESVSAPIEVVDTQPPKMVWFIGPDSAINPGDDISLRFYAQDNKGITRMTLRVTGAFEVDWTGDLEEPLGQFTAIVDVPVALGARLDVPADLVVIVGDAAGHTDSATMSVQLKDTRVPVATMDFGALRPDGTIRTGETFLVYVNASDNQRLTYIGFGGAGLRDSLPARGYDDSHTFRVTVPASWITTRPRLFAWARDASGNISTASEFFGRSVPVYNWVDRPITTVPLSSSELANVLLDTKRNALYRLRTVGHASRVIDLIDLGGGSGTTTIALTDAGPSFALSATGDSILLTLPGARALGIVDLTRPIRSLTVLPLQYEGQASRVPSSVQPSGEHLFVALATFSLGDWGRLLDVNLRTGTQVIRSDLNGDVRVAPQPILLPLFGGRLFVGTDAGGSCDPCFLYSPENDLFTPTSKLGSIDTRYFVPSPSGRFFAVGTGVFDADLETVANLPTWDWPFPPLMAFSHDDQAVYQNTTYGYQKVRFPDGGLLEQVKLPMRPQRLIALPDGSRLIVVADSALMVVDLR